MRKIIHCDADCFFAAVEMREDPSLRHRPMAVGGAADRRGVISTCNYEARRFGVKSAMASAYARRLCPDLVILPPRIELYRQVSRDMRAIFEAYTDRIEPLSLDEAFLDVSDSDQLNGSATLLAQAIRRDIARDLGITVSAGVAANKFLAKVASDWHKPNGLFVIAPQAVDEFVRQLPVERIPGVGRATAQRLQQLGVASCGDLQAIDLLELSERFGAQGVRLHALCRGRDERPVSVDRRRKSLSVEQTYPEDLPDIEACLNQLPALLQSLLRRLRRVDRDYRVVKAFVKLKFEDFSATTLERAGAQMTLRAYAELCREAYARRERPVRLLGLGVRFVDLRTDPLMRQLPLFE